MALPSPTTLAAIIVAICSDVFSGPVNAALTVLFVVGRQRHLFADLLDAALLAGAARAIIGASVVAFLLVQLLWVAQGRIETRHWNGPGKVLLFPCRTSHQRKFPQTHAFSYSYLTIGIPVGFEGNAGGMVSVGAKGKHGLFSWLFGPPRGWFTIDAGDYLERGRAELGLRGKLDEYLRTQVGAHSQFSQGHCILTPPGTRPGRLPACLPCHCCPLPRVPLQPGIVLVSVRCRQAPGCHDPGGQQHLRRAPNVLVDPG
jgi:hypothetical protein